MMSQKKCSKCGGIKSSAEFYRDASSSTGLDSCCRDCRRAYARSRPKRDCPSVASKICSHCCEVKPACEFGKNARESTGLQPWCRACHSAYVNNKPKVDAPVVSEKRCSKCEIVKPAGDFCKDKYKPSGLRSWCRQCRNLARAATRNESPRVEIQKCRGCGAVKPARDFPRCKENASGLKSLCQACRMQAKGGGQNEARRPEDVLGVASLRGALKRKASNVETFDGFPLDRRVRTGNPGEGCESPAGRLDLAAGESPLCFSVPTRRRSPRKGGCPTSNSPTSQWNNDAGMWSQAEDALGAAWIAQNTTPAHADLGLIPSPQLSESFFSPSPFSLELEPRVKVEHLPESPGTQPFVAPPSTGIWLEAVDARVRCPVVLQRAIELPLAAPGSLVPCVQVVVTEGVEVKQLNCPNVLCIAQTANVEDDRCGLEVLAEAAEMVTSKPLCAEVPIQ